MRYSSPLRYPGGKGKLTNFIKLIFYLNGLIDGQYVEPYAGGASIAFHLLFGEYVHDVYLNDIDKCIYAFWYSVIFETEELCRKINDTPVTVDNWHRQKLVKTNASDVSILELGFSTFFLNRTNRSGIISGGVIGGIQQNGKWKIDARYNKKGLIERIEKIAQYKDRIHLYNIDASCFLIDIEQVLSEKALIYLDPPYYQKGQDLYENHYSHEDHSRIAGIVRKKINSNWLITYDNLPVIRGFYAGFRWLNYCLNYSASERYKGSEVMFFSDELDIPDMDNPVSISKKNLKRYTSSQLSLLI